MILDVNGIKLDVEYSITENGRVLISKVKKEDKVLESNSRGEYLMMTLNNMYFTVKREQIIKALPEYSTDLW
ncbi:hypothetical protein [Clostridium massiliamazoniense]|uniref:hypothetical protein n=1 Tax=Clostridium massiliamazoniense TaxID=1347366 RepID=UPI0006D84A58|nr:hypothetical protein [Clostridium massiliamazoniense]